MTRQTIAPLDGLWLTSSARQAHELVNMVNDGTISLDAPYQRPDVWTDEQRVALIRSWLIGLPIPAIIVADRLHTRRKGGIDYADFPYVVIDGKQRLRTAQMWWAGELAIPASWIPAVEVEQAEDTDDGPYVRVTGLAKPYRRHLKFSFQLPMVEAKLHSLAQEAEVYLLINGYGTPQTEDDMANAARVADGE